MEIYLVRHGQSAANAGLTTDLDSSLTDLGRRQAGATADRLYDERITHILVSPLQRTLQTAEPISHRLHLPAIAYPAVCEYFSPKYPGYRTFQGLSVPEISELFPFVEFRPDVRCTDRWWPQDFEDHRIAYARAVEARDWLTSNYPDTAHIVIVSHADPIGRLIEAFLRIDPHPDSPPWSDNCAITHLHAAAGADATRLPPGTTGADETRLPPSTTGAASIVSINDTSHLQEIHAA